MRKIDKSKILSTEYKMWMDVELNEKNKKHPTNSRHKYRQDVIMNLLHCQRGVCAYTERFLCDPEDFSEDKWEKGRYNSKKRKYYGELEHFNPVLKKNKYWEWGNLFVISGTINRVKNKKEVDYILKPDSPEYDPFSLLEYNEKKHIFVPHTDIKDETIRERIRRMIDVLHLNFTPVHRERRRFFKLVAKSKEHAQPVEIYQFFTAHKMAETTRKEA
jgi:hypothetical protein